ncbi:MAG: hypothetical protein AUF67_05930 [Acidobacteria bacterium 13_1_20CM_58_21]|nr:MAG: hypothetical protein AUF67_05930 [Acidobacteria bacterium 13_1_20CM_58_21]
MPLDGKILGFKNRWYGHAMETAEERDLEPGLKILMVSPVYFCATKLEAFGDRGKNDYLGSRDLEDLIAVVDGRAELVGEIQVAQSDVRSYLAKEVTKLLAARGFGDALQGHLAPDSASQERITTVMARLKEIASL